MNAVAKQIYGIKDPKLVYHDRKTKSQILVSMGFIEKSNEDELFQCEILKDGEVMCKGSGKTKKKAEQNASYNALLQLNVLN